MDQIKVLVVDDHDLIILAARQIISKIPGMKMVGMASDGEEGYNKVKELRPDVVILDVILPGMDGIELTEIITEEFPETKVVLYSASVSEEVIVTGFEAGAMAYVPKNFKPGQLIEAIQTVVKGEHYSKGFVSEILIDNFLKTKNKKDSPNNKLTEREIEILQSITQGMTNQKMADNLHISVRTVEAHKSNIMKKLKLGSTAELVVYAIKHKIIKI
jgi:DNA-binding NarL/FixJ family response regulator